MKFYSERRDGTGESSEEEWHGSGEIILETPQIGVEIPAKASNIYPEESQKAERTHAKCEDGQVVRRKIPQ